MKPLNDRWDPKFVTEMAKKTNQRSSEVGGHSYFQQIERYGLPIMFAELANIMSRLEMMLWENEPLDSIEKNPDRLLDLLVDLGNYAKFTYEGSWFIINELESGRSVRDSDSPHGEDPGNIVLSQREPGE